MTHQQEYGGAKIIPLGGVGPLTPFKDTLMWRHITFRDRIGIIAMTGARISKILNQPTSLVLQANYKAIVTSVNHDINEIEYQLKLLQQTSD